MWRLVIASGNPLVLRGLYGQIAAVSNLAVVAEATTPDEVVFAIEACHPDLLLLHPERFPGTGLEVAQTVRERFPKVKIVVVACPPRFTSFWRTPDSTSRVASLTTSL